jgi:hypothetical protein
MDERQEFFDGQVSRHLRYEPRRGFRGQWWAEDWSGPGGTLHAERIISRSFDAKVVFTDTDGQASEPDYIYEGGEYPHLDELFGPDWWPQYTKPLSGLAVR